MSTKTDLIVTPLDRALQTPSDSPKSASDYQRRRLRLGIYGVGSGTCIAGLVLILAINGFALRAGSGMWVAILLGTSVAVLMSMIQFALDASGRRLDQQFGLISGNRDGAGFDGLIEAGRWLISFVTGCAITAVCVMYGGRSWPWLLIALAGLGVVLRLLLRGRPAGREVPIDLTWFDEVRAIFAAKKLPGIENLMAIDLDEKTLAGGRCGWLGGQLWISQAVAELQPSVAATLISRELAHTEYRHATTSAMISFMTLAVSIGLSFGLLSQTEPSLTAHAPSVVLLLSSIVTLCSFVSLFVLPAIGRSQVISVDRWVARHFGVAAAFAMLDALAARNLPNEALDPVKAYVFHPIPTMSARRASVETIQLERQSKP